MYTRSYRSACGCSTSSSAARRGPPRRPRTPGAASAWRSCARTRSGGRAEARRAQAGVQPLPARRPAPCAARAPEAGGQSGGGGLERAGHQEHLAHVVRRQRRHDRARHLADRDAADESLLLEPLERGPHGRPADAEPRREIRLDQRRAGCQAAGDDQFAQPIVGRARRGRPAARRARFAVRRMLPKRPPPAGRSLTHAHMYTPDRGILHTKKEPSNVYMSACSKRNLMAVGQSRSLARSAAPARRSSFPRSEEFDDLGPSHVARSAPLRRRPVDPGATRHPRPHRVGPGRRAGSADAQFRVKAFDQFVAMKKASPFKDLQWQFLGPTNISGRVVDIAVANRKGRTRVDLRRDRRRAASGRPRTRAHRSSRSSSRCPSAAGRRRRPSRRRTRTSSGTALARRTSSAAPTPAIGVYKSDGRRQDLAAHGARQHPHHPAHRHPPDQPRRSSTWPPAATSGPTTRSAASSRRSTAARPGTRCSTSTRGPPRTTW